MKSLVIAEKPSVARDIARVLKCNKNISGAIEGNQYIVTWALGHLVTLADPEGYDKKFKEWNMQVLPMMPKKMELVVIKKTAKQYNAVKTQMFRKDVGDIIIATDAGREGELVARWILEKANCHKPIKRLWISSVTDKAIKEGFAKLVDGRKYNDLYAAAVSRAEADWLVGINATRALTCKYNAQLSCGRVQTPTLAMIAKREEEIRTFQPKEYYGVTVQAGKIKWTWQDQKSGSYRSFSKERIEKLAEDLNGEIMVVEQVEKSAKKSFAPGLYDLTELQRDANRRFGFSAKETLNIMQRLYENHKVLTYPRTDSKYIGNDVVDTLKDRLRAVSVGPYKKLAGSLIMKPIKVNKSFVDDKKVSDHHAIIPTEQFVQLEHMTNEERKIYDLVVLDFDSISQGALIPEQRAVYLLLDLLQATQPVYLVDEQEKMQISKSSMDSDLRNLRADLAKYNLTLTTSPKLGAQIEGNERSIRTMFGDVLTRQHALVTLIAQQLIASGVYVDKMKEVFTKQDVTYIRDLLRRCFPKGALAANDMYSQQVTVLLIIWLHRVRNGHYVKDDETTVDLNKENAKFLNELIQHYALKIDVASELGYVGFLINSFNRRGAIDLDDWVKAQIFSVALIDHMETEIGFPFSKNEKLFEELYNHMTALFKRLSQHVKVVNPLRKTIQQGYGPIYDVQDGTLSADHV